MVGPVSFQCTATDGPVLGLFKPDERESGKRPAAGPISPVKHDAGGSAGSALPLMSPYISRDVGLPPIAMKNANQDLNPLRQPNVLPFSASWRCYLGKSPNR